MFSNLSDLTFERTGKQSIGFYFAYLFIFLLIFGVLGALYSGVTSNTDFQTGARIGNIISIILCLTLSSAIVFKKNIFSFKTAVFILVSGVLAIFIGAIGGLIPIAYLTTQQKNT